MSLVYGVKPIERSWRLNIQLPLQVAVQPRQETLQEAQKDQDDTVFWTNGSKLDIRKAGSAVIWLEKNSDKRQEKQQYLEENKELFDAELWIILYALKLRIKKTKNRSPIIITVFTDLHVVIAKIFKPKVRPNRGVIRDFIYRNTLNIKNNGYTLLL